jgi:hypothetical protein
MRFEQAIARAAICAASAFSAAPAMPAPPEPLVVTRLPDPDPNFVSPPPQGTQQRRNSPGQRQDATLEEAMQDFSRALGQAAMVEQHRLDARCNAGLPPDATAEQRFAWAASCRYTRR